MSRYSMVDVSARLRHAEDGRLEWSVVGMVADSQTFHLVRIDVASGGRQTHRKEIKRRF